MNNIFDELFEKIIAMWPERLEIHEKKVHPNGGATIPLLSSIHDEIEERVFAMDDNEMLLCMDWAIFTVLHQTARIQDEIIPKNIDREKVRTIFEQNLKLNKT